MRNKAVLILSGHNNRGIIACCRFFRSNNIPFFIVASEGIDRISYTAYKKNIIYKREDKTLNVGDFLSYKKYILERGKYKQILVLPTTEFLNRFLIKEKIKLENEGFIIPLVNKNLYAEISDKYSFGKLCGKNEIVVPKEYEDIDESMIPFVAKPRKYFVDGKIVNKRPILIKNPEDYRQLRQEKLNTDFYFQQFVGGKSYYLLYYFDKHGNYNVHSQQNLMQQGNGLSITAAVSSNFHSKEISKKFVKVFQDKKYRGIVMIEVKVFKGKIYVIEANPRLWGPSQLILDSGMDLFYLLAEDFGLLNREEIKQPVYKAGVKYFWSGGIYEDRYQKRNITFHHYDKIKFFHDFKDWMKADVYLRNDTYELYKKELNNQL
jgi:predicted ATP-grasp superfamily ATP-dependent carboligase